MARPRSFDETALLDAARERFWSHGYTSTSIEDVSRDCGVGNGSIYAAYGSKKNLYLAVLTRYCRDLQSSVGQAMDGRTGDPRTSLRTYLEMIICDCVDQPGRRGCLMLNSIGLIDQVPEVAGMIATTTRQLEAHIDRRLHRDLLGDTTTPVPWISDLAAEFVTLSQGLIQRSRLAEDAATLRRIADTAVARLDVTTQESAHLPEPDRPA